MYNPSRCLRHHFSPKVLIAALIMLMVWPAATFAQSDPQLYCGDLAAEDCAIVTMARDTMKDLTSLTSTADFELNISNIPDAPFDELTLEFDQRSSFVYSAEALAVREQLTDAEMLNAMMQEDPVAFIELTLDLLNGSSFDTDYRISLSDDSMMLIQQAIEEDSGEELPFDLPNEFAVKARFIDGNLFTNFGEMLDPLPGIIIKGDMWFGMEYTPFMDFMLPLMRAEGELDPMEPDEAALISQYMAASTNSGGSPLITTIAGFSTSDEIIESFNLERIDDGSSGTATFRTTVDYATLLADPTVQDFLAMLIRDPEFGDTPMSDEEMTEVMAMVQLMGPTVLDSLGLEVTEEIDTATGLLVRGEFHLNWDIEELAPLLQMAGGPDISELGELPVLAMNGTVDYSDHGADIVIEEPENALIIAMSEILELIPEDELEAMMSGPGADEFDFAEADSAVAAVPLAAAPAAAPEGMVGDSEMATSFVASATEAMGNGDYESALSLLTGAIAIEPENVGYLKMRAEVYEEIGEYDAALADFSAAIALDPQDASSYFDRALVHYSLDDLESEIADYTSVIALEPDSAQVYYYRGLSYEDLGEVDLAMADYTQALTLNPEYSDVYWFRGYLYENMGENDAAVADLQRYLELTPDASDREDVEATIAELQ